MILSFAACAPKGEPQTNLEHRIGHDVGNIDDQSFNQGTWEGVKQFAEANGKTYNYYRPSEDSDEARVEAMKTAVEKGAKVIVCPGYMFGPSITEAAGSVSGSHVLRHRSDYV